MTVRELIAWLRTQDLVATVEILKRNKRQGWTNDTFDRVAFNPDEHSDYTDFRDNQFAKGEPYEDERTLFLGRDG